MFFAPKIFVLFSQEAGLTLEEEKTEPFSDINKILESLKKRDVTIALEWAEEHKVFLARHVRENVFQEFLFIFCYNECVYFMTFIYRNLV